MLSSLELNWVRNVDKSMVVPEVVFESLSDRGGYYLRPTREEVYIEGRYYDRQRGMIVIGTKYPRNFASVLAHEWRHHWQFCHGWKYDGIGLSGVHADYDTGIRDYFWKSWSEADAFKFELAKAPGADYHDYWRCLLENGSM